MTDSALVPLIGRWQKLLGALGDLSIPLFAISMSFGITWQWAFFLSGVAVYVLLAALDRNPLARLLCDYKAIRTAPLTVPMAVFVMAATLSGLANGGFVEGMSSLASLRGMLVYFWAYQSFNAKPLLVVKAALVALITGSVAGVWGMVQQITGFHPYTFAYLQGTGFMAGPMSYAGLMQILSMLAFGLTITKSYRRLPAPFCQPIFFAVIVVCNLCGLLFSGERSAWLGVACAIFISTAFLSWRRALRAGLVVLAVAALLWFCVPVVQQRLAPLLNWQSDVSVRVRLDLWRESIQLFARKPIFGVGIRNFPHHAIPEALGQGHVALDHAHSNYLHILATTGLFGIAAYVFLLFNIFSLALTNLKAAALKQAENAELGINLGILAGIIALLISGIFEYNFGTAQIRLTQWFLFGVLAKTQKQ